MEIFVNKILMQIIFAVFISIPLSIRAISFKPWRQPIKRGVMAGMVFLSIGFVCYLFITTGENLSAFTVWFTYLVLAIYLSSTIVSFYFSWPLTKRHEKVDHKMKDKHYITIDSMTGKHGNVSVVLLSVIFLSGKDQSKHFVDPDFGAWLMDEIYTGKKLLSVKKGIFQKKWVCPVCHAQLNANGALPRQIDYTLCYKEFSPFTLQITLPAVVCPECNRICPIDKDGTLANQLNEAVLQAFKSEHVKP